MGASLAQSLRTLGRFGPPAASLAISWLYRFDAIAMFSCVDRYALRRSQYEK
jgi:hypothetical protein